jgi:phage terminase large subunit-like protein
VPLIPFLVALVVIVAFILALPLLLVLRYRVGIARRPARRWMVTLNLVSLLISAALFLWVAALTSFWVPRAFGYSSAGLGSGCLLGFLGLGLTRWERTATSLYFTPNRWLVLVVTLAVSARLVYGVWRIWRAWHTTGHDTSWLAAAGIPGSMAVGAVVLGYYLTYSAGVRWRLRNF